MSDTRTSNDERLNAQQWTDAVWRWQLDEIERLQAECDRLREMLGLPRKYDRDQRPL